MRAGVLLVAALGAAAAARAETQRLKPTAGVPTFAVRAPILTVKPGDVLESESLWGEYYERLGGAWPGEVGPIAIEGAQPGDTLVVEVLKVRPNRDTAVSTQGARFGALVPDYGTAALNEPMPRARYVWRIDRQRMTGTLDLPGSSVKSLTTPLRPMLGRVAVAPAGEEAFGGLWPGPFGGNMDASDVREGTTVLLPVFHDGALFYFGDVHALQGDGEICGSGLETTADVAFRFGLQKGRKIEWPRLEDAEHLMVAGSARPLTDALRIATGELVRWLVADYGFSMPDAYQAVSQLGVLRVANAVDPLYTVVAKFPKRFLPSPAGAAREAAAGVRLGDVSWREAETLLSPDRVVVLPLGAGSKEHGPHLPLRTDEIEAEAYARALAGARPVALLPTLSYGYYSKMLEYPGTTSLSLATLRDAVVQICRSIAAHGPRRFYVLNTGVRTTDALQPAAEILAREGILMRFTRLPEVGRVVIDGLREQAYGSHADEIETSLMLYLAPGLVRMDRAVADGARVSDGPLTRDAANAAGHYSPSGVFGDPTLARWQKGERIFAAVVADVIASVDALAREPLPAGHPRSPLDGTETR